MDTDYNHWDEVTTYMREARDTNRSLTASLREANMIAAVEMDRNLVLEDRIIGLEERINQQAKRMRSCPYCRESGL